MAAWSALIILSLTETTRALLGPGAMLMNMVRHEGVTALGFAISLVVSVLTAIALIPAYGADGAAWGMFFGVTGMSVFLWQKARRNLNLDPTAFGRPVRRDEPRDQR
jgi:O-antigen/teichoic acid export membrane protein